MFTTIERCPRRAEVDVFLNTDGAVTMQAFAFKTDEDSVDWTEFSVPALTAEFIAHSINPETAKIECGEAEACYKLIDAFKTGLRMLEDAVFDDDFTSLGKYAHG